MYKTLLLINIHVKIRNRSIIMPFSGVTAHGPVDNDGVTALNLRPQILLPEPDGNEPTDVRLI
jgi:hypothetical protein